MSWRQVLVALVCTSLMVQSSPCSWVEVLTSWTKGHKAVAKLQMEETVDHWDVDVLFSEPVINFEAWKGHVTKISDTYYTVSNTCYNNMVYSCQCFELPYLVRHEPLWEGNTTFKFNGELVSACEAPACDVILSVGEVNTTSSAGAYYVQERTCCLILRSKNDTFLNMRGLESICSNDPGGPCTYQSVTNLEKNISAVSFCLSDINKISTSTCCSYSNGALCHRFGNESNTNVDPIAGTCSNECQNIHNCNDDPDHAWCKCSSRYRTPQNVTLNSDLSYNKFSLCIPDYTKGLELLTETWCNVVFSCMEAYYHSQYAWPEINHILYGGTKNNDLWTCRVGVPGNWYTHPFTFDYENCCTDFCNTDNTCYGTLSQCFSSNSSSICVSKCKTFKQDHNKFCNDLKTTC